MLEKLDPYRFQCLATLQEGPGTLTAKVVDLGDGAVRVARLFSTETLREAAVRRMGRDALVLLGQELPGLTTWREVVEKDDHLLLLRDWAEGLSLPHHPRFSIEADPKSRGARASEDEMLALLERLLLALTPVHDRGRAIDRLTPANCFVGREDRVALTDWCVRLPYGRAARGEDRWRLPGAYAAPEVVRGIPSSPSSDLYSLAAILFEVATGRLPGPADENQDRSDCLGTRLWPVLQRLLRGNPAARPLTARHALLALERTPPRPTLGERALFRSPRLIGRDAELQELFASLDRVQAGSGDLIFVHGEEGVGKTRLVGKLEREAALRGVAVLRSTAPDPSGLPLGRLAACFDAIARDKSTWSPQEIEEALQRDGRVMLEVSPTFHDLESVRRLPEPPVLGGEAARRRILRVAARCLQVYSRRRPTLLVLDDLESADALTLDFVRYLARTVIASDGGRKGSALLLVACYAEENDARGPLRAAAVALRARKLARELALKPLAPHEVRDLLVERLGSDELPGSFVARVMKDTGGVPLKIEETLAWLASREVLRWPAAEWTQAWDLALKARRIESSAPSPDDSISLLLGRSVVDAPRAALSPLALRCEGLRPEARRVLETIGLAGDGAALSVLRSASGLAPAAFHEGLVEGLRMQAIREEAPEAFAFRHSQVRAAILGSMEVTTRRAVHARIGLAIEQHVGRLDERSPLLLAHHFHQAGDVERSLLYLPLAARILKDRHAPGEALPLFSRFFRHLDSVDPEDREQHVPKRIQALQSMAETLVELGRGPEASNLYREMAAISEACGRERDLVTAWSGLAALSLDLGDLDTAESFANRSAELAKDRDLALVVADSLRVLGIVWFRRKKHAQAIWDLGGALEISKEQGEPLGVARCYLALGEVHAARYRYRPALSAFRKAYRNFRALDDKVGASQTLNSLGRIQLMLGDAARAIAYHREAVRIEREADDREGLGTTLDLLGESYREKGDLSRAEEAFKEALGIRRELANVRASADSLLHIAQVKLQAGHIDEALGLLEQALALARRTSNARAEVGALVRLAQARMQRGEATLAAELAEDGLKRAELCGETALECRAQLVLAATLAAPEEALRAAHRAVESATRVGLLDLLFRAHVGLADLLRGRGEEEAAHEHFSKALDAASTLMSAARSAREGFLRREEVRASLDGARQFVAGRFEGDVAERFPVLKLVGPKLAPAGT